MSADADPFERVWLNPNRPGVIHRSPDCATQTADAIPSFRAFGDVGGVGRCGVCLGQRAPDVPEDVPVGGELRALRETHGLTQNDVAERLGLADGSAVGSWENGRRRPSSEHQAGLRELAADLEDDEADDDEDEDERTWADFPRECCGETLDDLLAWAIHRTEAHEVTQSTLDHLEPGEFEARVDESENIAELRDAIGWSYERLMRALNIYGLADVVGPSGPDIDDVDAGDDSWKQIYQDVATDGGSR